jgi:thiamine biosynthesis protein ThiS
MISKTTNAITIFINSENMKVEYKSTLNQALDLWLENADLKNGVKNGVKNDAKYVVALNQNFIPRALYANTVLQANDDIELLSPMAGG